MINVSQYATNLALFFELSVNPQEENPSHLPATASESYPTLSIVSVRVVHTWIYGLTTPLAFWLEKGAGRGRGRIASMFLSTLSRLANFLTRLQTFPALHDCHFAPINVSTRCHDGRGGYIMSELSTRVTETDNDSIDRACHALCISIYIYILILAHSEDNSSSHVNCCDHNVDRGGICRDTETMRRPPRTNVMSSASTTMGHTLLTSCCLSVATQNCISTESGNSCRTTADHHHHPTPTPPHTHIHFFSFFFQSLSAVTGCTSGLMIVPIRALRWQPAICWHDLNISHHFVCLCLQNFLQHRAAQASGPRTPDRLRLPWRSQAVSTAGLRSPLLRRTRAGVTAKAVKQGSAAGACLTSHLELGKR